MRSIHIASPRDASSTGPRGSSFDCFPRRAATRAKTQNGAPSAANLRELSKVRTCFHTRKMNVICSKELTVKDRAGLSDAFEIGRLKIIGFHARAVKSKTHMLSTIGTPAASRSGLMLGTLAWVTDEIRRLHSARLRYHCCGCEFRKSLDGTISETRKNRG